MAKASKRRQLLERAAQRGKYAPLHEFLRSKKGSEWRTTFNDLEEILGFELPDSAHIHRPWWANQGEGGGHSHALSWQMAGWKTSQVDFGNETLVFIKDKNAPIG